MNFDISISDFVLYKNLNQYRFFIEILICHGTICFWKSSYKRQLQFNFELIYPQTESEEVFLYNKSSCTYTSTGSNTANCVVRFWPDTSRRADATRCYGGPDGPAPRALRLTPDPETHCNFM